MSKIELKPVDAIWLFALGLAPAFAGGALILLICLLFLGAAQRLRGNSGTVPEPVQMVAAVFILYFAYFYLHGAVMGGSVWAPYATMKGNIPLLIVAGYGLLGAGSFHRFTSHQLGVWASVAVHLTVFSVVFFYLARYFSPSFVAPIEHTVWAYGELRLEMFSRNPLMFASLLTTVSFLSLLGYEQKNQRQRLLAVTALPLGLLVVLAGAQVRGVLVLCIPLGLLAVWYLQISLKKALIFAALVLCLLIAAFFIFDPVAAVFDRLIGRMTATWVMLTSGGQVPEYSLLYRIRMFQLGWAAILESPWLGYGYQNRFEIIIPLMAAADNFRYGHLHNAFLNHWVAGGVPGLTLCIVFLGLPMFLWKRYANDSRDLRFLALLITIMMVGTGLYTAILGHFVHTTFYGMMILTLALLLKPLHAKTRTKVNKPRPAAAPRARS